ncbi:FecR family protein [Luteimonas sp. RIT-PG2_3]
MNVSTSSSLQDLPRSAEDWLARLLSPDCSADEHRAFEDWLALSPRNALDYAEVERIHRWAGALRSDPALRNPEHHADETPTRHCRRVWHPGFALAAALLLALGGAIWLFIDLRQAAPLQYATQIGEQRRVDLPDGSGLFLDANTLVLVAYGHSQRHVELLSGRLQANVAHDGNRPFVVTSGVGTTRALGTVFQVERQNGRTVVSLLQGRVVVDTRDNQSVHSLELRPLQQLTYGPTGEFAHRTSIDRSDAESWLHGRLTFNEERLADLIAQFNRYSQNQLILSDAALGDIRVSGMFDAHDQPGLLAALHQGWGLQAKQVAKHQIELSTSKQ